MRSHHHHHPHHLMPLTVVAVTATTVGLPVTASQAAQTTPGGTDNPVISASCTWSATPSTMNQGTLHLVLSAPAETAGSSFDSKFYYASNFPTGAGPASGTVAADGTATVNLTLTHEGEAPSRLYFHTYANRSMQSYLATIDARSCQPPQAAPAVAQTRQPGNDDDTVAVTGGTVTHDTGWVGNRRVLSFDDGTWYRQGASVGNVLTVTLTDGGADTTRQESATTTRTVPNVVNQTTCTDPVVGTFRVTTYHPTTAGQVNTVAANSRRNSLPWLYDARNAPQLDRLDRTGKHTSLAGHVRTEFVTVKLSDVKRAGSLRGAIDARTAHLPNLGGRAEIGKDLTTAWLLAAGATTTHPWTSSPSTAAAKAQVEHDAVELPTPKCTTKQVSRGTRTVTVATTRTVAVPATTPKPVVELTVR